MHGCDGKFLKKLFGRSEFVSTARNGLYYGVVFIEVIYFFAETQNVWLDSVGKDIHTHVPDVFQNHGASEDSVAILHEVLEEHELFAS